MRGHLTRCSFRKATELGKRQAARTALNARRSAAAVTIQKHTRRRIATKKVSFLFLSCAHHGGQGAHMAEASVG